MPGQVAIKYRGHPGTFGAAYDQHPAKEDWAQAHMLAKYGPHLGHLPHSINTIIMHHARYVRYIIRNINPNTLTDLSVGVLAGAHHRRRSSGPGVVSILPCPPEELPCSSNNSVRFDHNIGAAYGEMQKKPCFHQISTMVCSTRNREYNDPSV